MSTRLARFSDHWRRAAVRRYSTILQSVSFDGVRSLHDDTLTLSPAVTVITGGNGVGKTTLLQCIAQLLAGGEVLEDGGQRLSGALLTGEILDQGVMKRLTWLHGAPDEAGSTDLSSEYLWLDPAREALRTQLQVAEDANFDDLLEGVTPRELGADALATLSYVVGKDYSSCAVFEIDGYKYNGQPFPYFSVEAGGVRYASEDMGQGELALFLSLWALDYLPKNSILLLEEPETHISARSQKALLDVLMRAADLKGISTVMTTHSPVVLANVPFPCVRLLASEGDASRLHCRPLQYQVSRLAGGGAAFKNIMLVEDETARIFSQCVLEILDLDLRSQFVSVVVGSESDITKLLESLPFIPRWVTLIGVYDGDQRQSKTLGRGNWRHIFLPGDTAPEPLLTGRLRGGQDTSDVANLLGVAEAVMRTAVDECRGFDPHDWVIRVAESVQVSRDRFLEVLCRVWVRQNDALARAFLGDVREALEARGPSAAQSGTPVRGTG